LLAAGASDHPNCRAAFCRASRQDVKTRVGQASAFGTTERSSTKESSTMILTRSETSVQLTYTLEEYREFNHAIVTFRNEITSTLRNEVSSFDFDGETKEYFEILDQEFIHTLDYVDRWMLCYRTDSGMRLTFRIDEYDKFNENIGLLRIDLSYWQECYHDRGEYEKKDGLENLQDLIDVFSRLLGNRRILDS
jgi:hypothetical protein